MGRGKTDKGRKGHFQKCVFGSHFSLLLDKMEVSVQWPCFRASDLEGHVRLHVSDVCGGNVYPSVANR